MKTQPKPFTEKNTLTTLAVTISYVLFPLIYAFAFWHIREPQILTHWFICLASLAPWLLMSLAVLKLNRPGLMGTSLLAIIYIGFLSPGILAEQKASYYLIEVLSLTLSLFCILSYLRQTRFKTQSKTQNNPPNIKAPLNPISIS